MRGIDFLIGLLYSIPAVLIAISMHEFAHGFVSYKLGDPTPKMDGRLSLNPFRHLDVMGTLCLLVAGFGWAKPVIVNPEYYKNKKRGMVLVALAGPVMNFLLAFLFLFLYYLLWKLMGGYSGTGMGVVKNLMINCILINIGLGTFNLIPFPPLDGSKVLMAVLPEKAYFSYMRYERYGQFVLFLLLILGVLDRPLSFVRSGILTGMSNLVWKILGM